jgi:NNP family nitrate/nitrite transporter-like MFS transporter
MMFLLGICLGLWQGLVSSSTSATTTRQTIGTVSGIVGLAGGLGGFVLPIMFGALIDLTGIRSSAFMLMYGVVWVSLDLDVLDRGAQDTELMGRNSPQFHLAG